MIFIQLAELQEENEMIQLLTGCQYFHKMFLDEYEREVFLLLNMSQTFSYNFLTNLTLPDDDIVTKLWNKGLFLN